MKKILTLILCAIGIFTLASCGGSDNDDDTPETPEVRTYSEVGEWTSGNYFLSLSSDHFLTAYVAPNFIDCGTYSRTDDVITSTNTYYSKSTTYTIKSMNESSMTIDVAYNDVHGDNKTRSLTLTKTSKTPTVRDNPVSGKSYTWLSDVFGNETYAFNTFNSGRKSGTKGSCRNYPIDFFYIYYDNRVYNQQFNPAGTQTPSIGGWNGKCGTGEITVDTVTYDNSGRIYEFYTVGNRL